MRLRSLRSAAAAGLVLATGLAVLQTGPAAAAANPDPAHVTDEAWWLMEQLQALQPGSRNGGQYTDKPGYHNTRAGNDSDDYSVRDAEDQGGPADKTAAYDWTFPDAQGGSYTTIALYSNRLLASAQNAADPRLDGWREFFGQADSDDDVEGWDFRYGEAASSEPSHLWHIHLSEDRDKVTSMDNKLAMLSVLKGETVEQWQGGGGGATGTLTGTPADLTGDGRPDLVARSADGTLRMYVHSGNAAAPYNAAPLTIGTGWGGMTWIGVADVTGDDRPDVLARTAEGHLKLYRHTGSATAPISGGGEVLGVGWQAVTAITLGDVTLDGRTDIVARLADGTLWQYPNQGASGSVLFRGRVRIGTGWNSLTAITTGDVDLDGEVDIVARFPDGTLRVYPHSGNASAPYGSPVQIGLGWNPITAVALTDVTGDGKTDLVGRWPDGTLRHFPHTGSTTAPYSTAPVQIGTGWSAITALT